jgi:hypothetical protein
MLDLFGWAISFIMLAGGYGVAHKKTWGLWAFMAGNMGWIYIGVATGLTSLIGISIAFAVMDLYAIHKWNQE